MPQISWRKVILNDYASLLYGGFCFLASYYATSDGLRAAGVLPLLRGRGGSQALIQPSVAFALVAAVVALVLLVALYVRLSRLRTIIIHGHRRLAKVSASNRAARAMQFTLELTEGSHIRAVSITVYRTKETRDIKVGDVVEVAISPHNPQHVLIVSQYAAP